MLKNDLLRYWDQASALVQVSANLYIILWLKLFWCDRSSGSWTLRIFPLLELRLPEKFWTPLRYRAIRCLRNGGTLMALVSIENVDTDTYRIHSEYVYRM
jgi:hypothetical protein